MAEEHTEIQEVKEVKPQAVQAMTISQTGEIVAKDTTELMRQIKMLMKGQAFPKSFDTPEKCLAAWNLASSLKVVAPQRAISCMMFINGSLGIWGELPKALVESTKELEDFELYLIDNEYLPITPENKNLKAEPYAAVCKIKRKGRTKNTYTFSVDDAEKAKLLKKSGPWQDYAKIMLKRRATGEAYKFEFGDALLGIPLLDYDMNNYPELKDVSPEVTGDTAKVLNNLFTDTETTPVN